jgi:hypothetical protein
MLKILISNIPDIYFNFESYYSLVNISMNQMRRVIFLLMLVSTVLVLRLHHEPKSNSSLRIRRSIHVLNATARKSFFWSLKALAILPSPESFNYWTYDTILVRWDKDDLATKKKYNPRAKCLHDLLISSH